MKQSIIDPTALKRLLIRAVEALETIAKNVGSVKHEQIVHAPVEMSAVDIYRHTKSRLENAPLSSQIPAYFMPKNGSIVFDESPSNGFAIIDASGITIKLPPEHYPDYIRELLGRDDQTPVAITVGVNYREIGP